MKKIIKKYGILAALICVGIPVLSSLIIGGESESYGIGEIVGYSSIVVAMSLVYFAMRNYRDKENNGQINFVEGMKIGSMISAIGGIAFAIYNLVFVTVIDPDFNEKYFAHQMDLERGSEEFQKEFAALMESGGFMYTIAGGTVLMFFTVFLIGFVISVISSLILKTNKVQPAL
jgi:preprotein translocase subunit YajC